MHHSAKWDVRVVPNPTSEITALKIEEELYGQETLFVPSVFNWQSVSGSLELTGKENIRAGGQIRALATPRLEGACVPTLCV